ncbi:hypothetical protein JOD43_000031 [Pullulanibacillus pueri]|uniref:NERD domain-containing protein n=1 Tax=Pullulanibacillus pueri TaxID=1437324 RepID=A0A8J2ZQA1_9BACL|nr:nuclease-related domain-containing protein [Pullulanibacillus pueri]MBM7679872.1 hypothetical protein [Pullulanibacillus pueri]GGH73259.1 hypothetical protein GCM10007096_00310 [Pullulanibacillus pueri]
MLLFINLFRKKHKEPQNKKTSKSTPNETKTTRTHEEVAARKGELGEYKIDIQLEQLPKDCRYISDMLIANSKTKSGYSQIDHLVITPYGIYVIETKNFQGTIYGGKDKKTWLVNGKFKFMSPFVQNYGHIRALESIIPQKYHNYFISMVSFTKRSTFKVDTEYREISSNELIVYDVELSEFIHRKNSVLRLTNKESLLTELDISTIYEALLKANITNKDTRKNHVEALKNPKTDVSPKKDYSCVVCNKPVSEKVKTFCLSNKKFNGKIYCYDHQKSVSKAIYNLAKSPES